MSMSKFMTINAFFVKVNKSSVLAIVPEQFKAEVPYTSFVTVAEIYNVDVPGPSNQDAIVLLATAGTLCCGRCTIIINNEVSYF